MPQTYNTTLTHFTNFLTAYTHTLLHLRALYPPTSFVRSRFHNTPVYQSRHPLVCEWITDAITAVHEELLLGTISRIAIVIFWLGGSSNGGTTGDKGGASGSGPGLPKIMERYILDVSQFPVIAKPDRNTELAWDEDFERPSTSSSQSSSSDEAKSPNPSPNAKLPTKTKPLDADVDIDLSEQFRAALLSLTTRCSRLAPLPKECSFNISMELKDEADVDPPIRHPQPWIPVQPNLQKTGRKGAEGRTEEGEGRDLDGVKVTPIRAVEVGVFRFETWVEEGRAKFEMGGKAKSSTESTAS